MVIRNPFPLQRFTSQSTSFRASAAPTPPPPPPWRVELDRIGSAFGDIDRATRQLRAQYSQSTIAWDLDDLQQKLAKVQKKISAGPLGGLVGDGQLARCRASRRQDAENVVRTLAALADAATFLAADLDKIAEGGDAADMPDGASLASLRDAQRDLSRRLDAVKGGMPKEQTRFKLRTLAMVAVASISAVGAIVGATLGGPVLAISLAGMALGLAINISMHFAQRRDTGWKALTQLVDQFATSSRDLNYDALLDVTTRLTDGIRTMRASHQASRDEVSERLARLTDADRERVRMMAANEQHITRNEAGLQALQQNVEELMHVMTAIRGRIEGDGGLAAVVDQLGRQIASLREPDVAAEMPASRGREPAPTVAPGVPPNVRAALQR